MSDAGVSAVRRVLDAAADAGQIVTIWLRDDDAVRHTPALDRLFQLGRDFELPVAVAAIPALVEPSLPARLGAEPGARALVHGWRHADHAAPGRKKAEFGPDRLMPDLRREADEAIAAMRSFFGERALGVFVPPWNRAHPDLPACLQALGYRGLSTFAPRTAPVLQGLPVVNTHLDPVDWRGSRGPAGFDRLAGVLARSLPAGVSTPEPIGVLTHHLHFDEALWTHTARLLDALVSHRSVRVAPVEGLWRAERH